MTQNGIVKKHLDNGKVEVSVLRGTACGGNCGSCETCVYNSQILIEADNPIHASEGDRVLISSKTRDIIGAAFLVYMLPLVFFFLVYAVSYSFSFAQGICILFSFIGLVIGAVFSVLIGRRKREVHYELTSFLN